MMRKSVHVLSVFCLSMAAPAWGDTITRDQIIANADRLADAQLKVQGETTRIDWVAGTFYAGLADYLHHSPKSAEYQKAISELGTRAKWTPASMANSPFHADPMCIGMSFEEASADQHNTAMIGPLKARLDALADHLDESPAPKLTWTWCDALFMAPRDMARMSDMTGDKKYVNAMDKEWWRTTDLLYDPQEHLFFRDKSFFSKKTKDGHKVFWARGNGWVIAGLARVLTFMPANYPTRGKYLQMYKELAGKLASLQTPDGTWHPSLLDADDFATPETSGTALNCYAIAWGINNKILSRDEYLPVVIKAWTAMMSAERPDGLPGYVQSEGAAPARVRPSTTRLYASGGYLLSAMEVMKLAPIELSARNKPAIKIESPPMPPTTKP